MERELYYMSYDEFEALIKNVLAEIKEREIKVDTIVPVLRGGALIGSVLNNNMNGTSISYIHARRTLSNDTNAEFGTPSLKGITNDEEITGKHILIVDDLLDKGVTMKFVLEEIKKLNPASIHVAVLYNFTELENEDMYIVASEMKEKKWIVFPWERVF